MVDAGRGCGMEGSGRGMGDGDAGWRDRVSVGITVQLICGLLKFAVHPFS